jgi:ABC-type branched-subunit amino acid transport system ATPase component
MSNPLLEIRELSKRFGGLIAVENVSFDIYAGEILGLIGPNGAGKTTIFNLLAGALKADAGSIIMGGKSLLYQPLHRIAELGVMRTFQHNSPFSGMSLVDNILVGAHTCFDSSWFSILTNSPSAMRMEKEQRFTTHNYASSISFECPGKKVKNCGFSGSVRTDKSKNFTSIYIE